MKHYKVILAMLVVGVMGFAVSANAALTERNSWIGHYGISSDGWGGLADSGTVSAQIPSGATVVAAYLYTTTTWFNDGSLGTITLDGSTVTFAESWSGPDYPMMTGWSDVTSIVTSKFDGAGGIYDFTVTESNSSQTDGEALVVVYELATLPTATVAVMDGSAAMTGDTFNLNFADPLDPSDPDFFAEMTLGISYSYPYQSSNVMVNGQVLSQWAGDYNDGEDGANGSLITVGGFDDDLLNPTSYEDDDERYDLSSFVSSGDTTISVATDNPSRNDNIFLSTFYLAGEAGINELPPNPVIPEPSTMLLVGSGLVGLGTLVRKKRKAQ